MLILSCEDPNQSPDVACDNNDDEPDLLPPHTDSDDNESQHSDSDEGESEFQPLHIFIHSPFFPEPEDEPELPFFFPSFPELRLIDLLTSRQQRQNLLEMMFQVNVWM